jgi:hypothetical protein
MKVLRHTLVSDGPTDANLLPIIDWCLKETGGVTLSEGRRAEFWRLPSKPESLADRMAKAIELFPCDVLFVHRDAEKESLHVRANEIRIAHAELVGRRVKVPAVSVIPVRMLEAWLCFNEQAIRKAAGNPNGTSPLELPPLKRVESRPAKDDLNRALRTASGLTGRRLKKFDTASAFWRIVDYVEDFSPLRSLSAFQSFEASVKHLRESNWKPGFY